MKMVMECAAGEIAVAKGQNDAKLTEQGSGFDCGEVAAMDQGGNLLLFNPLNGTTQREDIVMSVGKKGDFHSSRHFQGFEFDSAVLEGLVQRLTLLGGQIFDYQT